ncbi:MAG: methylmalonyl-CoA mutase metallochaperone MeaB [Proteobacteria bacterium]|nr:methylmalonyl-CoA mutase metallochaperone MeaB [Pseudomonadota bacterium]
MSQDTHHSPEWVSENTGGGPASSIVQCSTTRRRDLSVDDYVDGVLSGDRTILARAITLVESNAEQHQAMAQQMIARLLPHSGKAIRVGITGVPGAGKSSLIETLGCKLCAAGHQLAVLAIDPSSSLSGGSILGDKTRMELLSHHANAFIRPSPSSGALGGVARKSRETMIVCEAAGFDVIIVETVGVGQSEITVRSMVDIFLLLQIAGAGDELQGIKKGVMERCDLIVVNKADGGNKQRAETARAGYQRIVHYLQPSTEGWQTQALACSATTGDGIDQLWVAVEAFCDNTRASGVFEKRRQRQNLDWMHNLIAEQLKRDFYNHPYVRMNLPLIEERIISGTLSPTHAATLLQNLDMSTEGA